jgi:DNA-binding response OmpR family regulator
MTAHILLVEDEIRLARFIELELETEGYRVSVAHDGMLGLNLARDSPPDLAILDWMLPGLTGIEICQRLRSSGIKIPVILLTARDEAGDRATGLAAGADDYMVKPFRMEELLARIDLHLQFKQKIDVNCRSQTVKV